MDRLHASWALSFLPPGIGLFLASFLALFLELLLIRWVPSHIRIVAYYSNLMLLSAFLGLGCGMLLAPRGLNLQRFFAPLLLLLVLFVSEIDGLNFRQGPDELRYAAIPGATTTFPIVTIFLLNSFVFLPLGQLIGNFFQMMPRLKAYSWDLGGAITGTVFFGLFSYFWFFPILGFLIVMGVYVIYCRGILQLTMSCALFAVSFVILLFGARVGAIWSPYNHIVVLEVEADGGLKPVSAPPTNIETLQDPPFYSVFVNRSGYMLVGTIDGRRYKEPNRYPGNIGRQWKMSLTDYSEPYHLPYFIRPKPKDVLVVGSGGGVDIEAALLAGAESVEAVEIDPVIIRIGQQFNPSQAYRDPRVSVYETDARTFFKQSRKRYDVVVFGFLDSQSLFSQMSNIRLDGYVHTRESFREAFGLLREGGLLSISFFTQKEIWLVDRLVTMVRSATNTVPLVYIRPTGQVIILAGKGFVPQGPSHFNAYRRVAWQPSGTPEATDDWPYLYLRRRFIPSDYLTNIAALLAVSLVFVFLSSDSKRRGINLHFFFLGAGFLLLETKSITAISLYFGTTWFVSMVVILGILLMALLANFAATKLRQASFILYLPLIASVVFLYLFPNQVVLAWSFPLRLMYSLTVIPLPIFFAGLIFSTTFRESEDASFSFGSNLLGAMVGGFAEYLGMITGMKALLLVVLVFYLASLLVRLRTLRILPARA